MSDRENNHAEQPPEEEQPVSAVPPAPAAAPAPRKPSSAPGWLALIGVLALGGAGAWLLPQVQQTREAFEGRIAAVESATGQEQADFEQLRDELLAELGTALDAQASGQREQSEGLNSALADMREQLARQREELVQQGEQLAQLGEQLARFNANDRASWLLAEVEYLLRLANQRLIMAGDTAAARALLGSADSVLRELDDVALHEVRAAVAADLAAVRAVPAIDVEGLYLRLSALIEQADGLVIFRLPDAQAQPRSAEGEGWRERLREGYEAALRKLSDYVAIRRRDVPMQALMDPQWEGLVRQNLRMLLEQAQVALLSGNGALYRASLERAGRWVEQFMQSDEATAGAMAREIDQLAAQRIAVAMPDLSRSLQALDAAMAQRLEQQREGGGD